MIQHSRGWYGFRGGPKSGELRAQVDARDERLIFWRVNGETYSQLARRFGLTRQRVGAILEAKRPDLLGWRR
jgi:Mor family transcriptional regulator